MKYLWNKIDYIKKTARIEWGVYQGLSCTDKTYAAQLQESMCWIQTKVPAKYPASMNDQNQTYREELKGKASIHHKEQYLFFSSMKRTLNHSQTQFINEPWSIKF